MKSPTLGSNGKLISTEEKLSATEINMRVLTRSENVLHYKINDATLVKEIAVMFQRQGPGVMAAGVRGVTRKASFILTFRRGETDVGIVFLVSSDDDDPERLLFWSELTDRVWSLSETELARLKEIIALAEQIKGEADPKRVSGKRLNRATTRRLSAKSSAIRPHLRTAHNRKLGGRSFRPTELGR